MKCHATIKNNRKDLIWKDVPDDKWRGGGEGAYRTLGIIWSLCVCMSLWRWGVHVLNV